jgi:hypothetical protein
LPSPTLTFGFIIATFYGAMFHLIFGGRARRLAVFIGVAWFGFAFGHIAGIWFSIDLFNIGALRFLPATLGTFILLGVAHLLSSPRAEEQNRR